ncbi:hypothetical protein GCM10010191_71790 [Actinomadura vinacea]|uniref:DUF397 domain-containing protein n=1 Tax=Actinomadura vinacea TaxID=115336 RepID=A0ABN3K2S9_9ACTN
MATPDTSRARWRTSRRSQQNGACVEVAAMHGAVAVRDSKDRQGPVLFLPRAVCQRFSQRVKHAGYDI